MRRGWAGKVEWAVNSDWSIFDSWAHFLNVYFFVWLLLLYALDECCSSNKIFQFPKQIITFTSFDFICIKYWAMGIKNRIYEPKKIVFMFNFVFYFNIYSRTLICWSLLVYNSGRYWEFNCFFRLKVVTREDIKAKKLANIEWFFKFPPLLALSQILIFKFQVIDSWRKRLTYKI